MLDILLEGEDSCAFLADLKRRPDLTGTPIVVISAVEDERRALALGADAYCAKAVDRQLLLHTLTRVTAPDTIKLVLVVDDEEISRYLLRRHPMTPQHLIVQAESGAEFIRLARAELLRDAADVVSKDGVSRERALAAVHDAMRNVGAP